MPAQSREDSVSAHDYAPLTLTIDFVQFADGETWFSHSPHARVKPNGVTAGARAAAGYLLYVLDSGDISKVMEVLSRIHVDAREPDRAAQNPEYGIFGFYSGVKSIVVRVVHEYEADGGGKVAAFLRSYGPDSRT